ncbi:MAG TPA: amidohydrolase family protein [Smithellaceae bacterium]|nr:amidohydrolase family protein [Smithellaceae bacterium]
MSKRFAFLLIVLSSITFIFMPGLQPALARQYDIVIHQGTVIDPEKNLNAVRDVGINGGRIAAISKTPLRGKKNIDARGLIVAPGFIDLHSHAINVPSNWMQAFDGVTTSLELEAGSFPIAKAYEAAGKKHLPLNYGFSVSWAMARLQVVDHVTLDGTFETALSNFGSPGWGKLLPEETSRKVIDAIEQGLKEGGVGIGLLIGYAPDSNREEYLAAGRLAAKYRVPTFTHIRPSYEYEPNGAMEGVLELLGVAAATGAHMHICHTTSSTVHKVYDTLEAVHTSQRKNLRITTETYPFGWGSTAIGSPFYDPANLPRAGIGPSDIYYAKTNEHIASIERLKEIRRKDPGGLAIALFLDESKPDQMKYIDDSILSPDMMIASDSMPFTIDGRTVDGDVWPLPAAAYAHPRSVATFTRVLERYVKEKKAMTVTEFVRRASLLPANLVAMAAPDAKRKGRLQAGMDADIVIFDLDGIKVRATYENPRTPSLGMRYVMVDGQLVISDGKLLPDVRPGRPLRGPAR